MNIISLFIHEYKTKYNKKTFSKIKRIEILTIYSTEQVQDSFRFLDLMHANSLQLKIKIMQLVNT